MDCKDNLSAITYGINDIRIENTPIPEINDHEVLIRIAQSGICGTDLTIALTGKLGNHLELKSPTIQGHEASGTVVKTGSKVKHLKKGDRVTIDPNIPCHICELCRTGNENLCEDVFTLSHPPDHGCLRRYIKHDANYCHKLPDNVSLDEGAVIEPLNCAIHGCLRGNIQLGSKVLVCGAGPIGLLSFLTAKAMGATNLCVTDILEERLKLAKKLGANSVLNVRNGTNEENSKKIIELFGGSRPDFTLECSGVESSTRLGITATRSGGKVVLVGLGRGEIKVPLVEAAMREVDIIGSSKYVSGFNHALDLVSSGKIDIKPLITHHFKLEDTAKAFEAAIKNDGTVSKILISC